MPARFPARALLLLLTVLRPALLGAQGRPSIAGRISDARNGAALPEARVEVVVEDMVFVAESDARGDYRLLDVPSGIHALRVLRDGYQPVRVPEVWVRPGKVEQVDVALEPGPRALGEVVVTAAPRLMGTTLSAHELTVERSLRYAATFFDPARLATNYAGVATTNDQANHFSVRGNGPATNAWLLEGAEIVNPNHLTNAGTASDRPTLSGGGTTILSAQMLGASRLLTGGFGAEYGNALGGIMDVRLRRGTAERRAYTLQAGLIGIDLSAEGPFREGAGGTYLVNYRYSTLGLLGAMGVALGDEDIGFKDLSFHVSLPLGQRAVLSLFGLGGASTTTFAAPADTAERSTDKDWTNVDYTGRMGATGATLFWNVGANTTWRTTVALSESVQRRTEDLLAADDAVVFTADDALAERKLSAVSQLRGRVGDAPWLVGVTAMERTVRKRLLLGDTVAVLQLRPHARIALPLAQGVQAELGLAYAHATRWTGVWEPRATLRFAHGRGSTALSAGQRSQLPQVQSFVVRTFPGAPDNAAVGPTVLQEVVLGHERQVGAAGAVKVELFHQHLRDVPLGDAAFYVPPFNENGSVVNAWDEVLIMPLSNHGEALNQGVELTLDRSFRNDWFMQVNATGLDARYRDYDGSWRSARWNTSVMTNAMFGREFEKHREGLTRSWGVSGRVNVMGGQRLTPIDTLRSAAFGYTVFDVARPFADQAPVFHRVDLRVYLKRERPGRTGMWALDLLNATNARNVSFRYYDQRLRQVVTKYQLGLIPNLSYRIEF
jgi:hypothetical protein